MNPYRQSEVRPDNQEPAKTVDPALNGGRLIRNDAHVCLTPDDDKIRPALERGDAWECGTCQKKWWWHGRYWLGHKPS